MQRGTRERESRFLQFTLQRPGDLIYIPHLLAHAVLNLDTGSPTILSGWDAATSRINTSFFKRWMSILLVCFVVSGAKFSVKKVYRHYATGCFLVFSIYRPSGKQREAKNHRSFWEQHSPKFKLSLHIEKAAPRKFISNRVPTLQSSELGYTRGDAFGSGPSS